MNMENQGLSRRRWDGSVLKAGSPTLLFMGFEELTHLAGKGNMPLPTPAQSMN